MKARGVRRVYYRCGCVCDYASRRRRAQRQGVALEQPQVGAVGLGSAWSDWPCVDWTGPRRSAPRGLRLVSTHFDRGCICRVWRRPICLPHL